MVGERSVIQERRVMIGWDRVPPGMESETKESLIELVDVDETRKEQGDWKRKYSIKDNVNTIVKRDPGYMGWLKVNPYRYVK